MQLLEAVLLPALLTKPQAEARGYQTLHLQRIFSIAYQSNNRFLKRSFKEK